MDNELKKLLRRRASLYHMCEENRQALDAVETKADAVRLYIKTIDWALEQGYPGLSVLRKYFSDCEEEGVFVGKHFTGETLIDKPVYVFHECSGTIRTGLNTAMRIIPMLYFADGCDMTVKPSDSKGLRTRVPLYVFGENSVSAKSDENAVFRFYNFTVE